MLRIDGDGEGHSAIFTTTDGQMWLPSEMPGRTPSVDDMATTSDGLLAVGHDGDYPAWHAMLWASEDGVAWSTLEAPPDTGYMRIVSSEAPLAVASPQWLWIRGEDGEWVRGTRLAGLTVRSGPSGFLAWDSGESGVSRPVLMHSRDLLEWRDVDLSTSPSLEAAIVDRGSVIFATDDEWILVPRRSRLPDSILTSSDGDVWQQVPRPPGMDSPSWIVRIGDQVQAYESPGDGRNDYRLWTWQLGEMAASPEESKTSLGGPPVEWQGSWITRTSRGPHNRELTFWRSDGEPRS
jgi:hypothetical protein